ncbi:MAG: FtsX-like permease family protein [Defluviitaleaceae bacterium]|nr:FtsX-like permease family protein [Defluviitaleaceae bacterium]
MSKILINKSLRSIWRNKASYFSSIFVLGLGISVLIGLLSVSVVLNESFENYFETQNFADIFIDVVAMPESSLDRLLRIDGIEQVEGTLSTSVTGQISGFDELININLIGISDTREISLLDDEVNITDDNYIWVSPDFFHTHQFTDGDTISLLIAGHYENFHIIGPAISPEHMPNTIQNSLIHTFGFVRPSVVERASGMEGFINGISLILTEGYNLDDIRYSIEDVILRYGIINNNEREHHWVYNMVSQQVTTVRVIPFTISPVFLVIAIGMLYVSLKRLVEFERTEIGTLKAFGFSNFFIQKGYFLQGLIVALLSFALSVGIGFLFGFFYYGLFKNFFYIEFVNFRLDIGIVIIGFLISIFSSFLAVWSGISSVMGIEPAQAMRAASPFSGSLSIKVDGVIANLLFAITGKLAIRSMIRNYKRSIISMVGIGTAISFVNVLFAVRNVLPEFINSPYTHIETSDANVILKEPVNRDSIYRYISSIDGVIYAEPMLILPIVLHNEGIMKPLNINGVSNNNQLFNVLDNKFNNIDISYGGIYLSNKIANEMGLKLGDAVLISHPQLETDMEVQVFGIIETGAGRGIYMDIDYLSSMFGSEILSNSILINVEEGELPAIIEYLTEMESVNTVNDNALQLKILQESGLNIDIFNIIIILGLIICFAVVYNISIIALTENQREYATLRILGFETKYVSEINVFEYVVLTIASIPLVVSSSYFIAPIIGNIFSPEFGTIISNISILSTTQAFFLGLFAVLVSCYMVKIKIKKFNLVDVLKER